MLAFIQAESGGRLPNWDDIEPDNTVTLSMNQLGRDLVTAHGYLGLMPLIVSECRIDPL